MGSWDFDGDEAFFFFVSIVISGVGFFRWYLNLLRRSRMARAGRIRCAFAVMPLVAMGALWFVLTRWADPKYVVGHFDYQLLFLSGGMAWLWLMVLFLPLFGMSVWADAIDRANAAAAWIVCGAMLGVTAIYAGSNIGSGPTIWTTIIPAIVATGYWIVLWLIVERMARPSEAITIDRDVAGGLRFAAYLFASGLILGRATAGDWTSWHSTFSDMVRVAWPNIVLAAAFATLAVVNRPTGERPRHR